MYKAVGIIPARYASKRFPGKPLVMINGKTMIQRVCERALSTAVLEEVYVATDDERIKAAVESFGGNVMMTSDQHRSGTDRCKEAAAKLSDSGKLFDVVINIQGDEPYIHPEQINSVFEAFSDPAVQIATLVKKIELKDELFDSSVIKVIFNNDHDAQYFSRQTIPFVQNLEKQDWLGFHTFYKHIGIYAYRFETLKSITSLDQGKLEKAESLEQLRWLENGYRIRIKITDKESFSVDKPDDLSKFLNIT